jgi:iron complex outermembrane receptor protein
MSGVMKNSLGLRTFIKYEHRFNELNRYDIQLGLESSKATSKIKNYSNEKGNPVNLMANDDLTARQHFAFLKMEVDWQERLFIELGGSLNLYGYAYEGFLPTPTGRQRKNLSAQLMPKLAASYLINKSLSLRSSISRGYSPPTLAEFRASDNVININLKAEAGWNYESGLTYQSTNGRLTANGSLYYFRLENAIVRRVTASDAEFFINAGGTKQLGAELQFSWLAFAGNDAQLFNHLRLNSAFSYSHYRFQNFQNAALDFSGNAVTGVPQQTLVTQISTSIFKGFFLFGQHSFVSPIPLDDANTVYSRKYHVIDVKTGFRDFAIKDFKLSLSLGINNVLNRSYSLGNDLNAVGNRYYNPAMGRNYFTSLRIGI